MSKVYIILVNWNGWRDTIECLESVLRNDFKEYKVIVCDNGSTDNSLEHIKIWADGKLDAFNGDVTLRKLSFPPISKPVPYTEIDREEAERRRAEVEEGPPLVLIRNGANLGFAGGNNVGMRYALADGDFDYVWLLNNDTVIQPDALTSLIERMKEKPEAGMCGSTLLHYEKPDKVQALGGGWYCKWLGLPWHYGRFGKLAASVDRKKAEARMNYVEGASMLVSRSFLQDVGLMCEDYFLYFEEPDWAIRARGRYALAYAPSSVVYHKVGRSIGTTSNPLHKSQVCDYYNIRNRLLFTSRHYPNALPSIIIFVMLEIFLRAALLMPARSKMLAGILWNYFVCRERFTGPCQADGS